MDITPNVNVIEIIWTGYCLYVVFLCNDRFWDALADRRSARSPRALRIAKGNIFNAGARLFRLAYFVTLGLRAMTQRNAQQPGNALIALVIGVAFIALAVLDHIDVRRETKDQRILLAEELARGALAPSNGNEERSEG